MDEPFGALDAITRERLQDELVGIQRSLRKTILFVTHDVEEAFRLGDQIAVLHDGQLMQVGTPVDLLANPADDFVRRLVGADNVLRQLQYLPVELALEPADGDISRAPRIAPDETLLHALLQLISTGATELIVEEDGKVPCRITLGTIYRGLQSGRRTSAATAH